MLFVCTPKQHAPNLAAPAVTRAAPVPPPQAPRCCSVTAGVQPPPATRVVHSDTQEMHAFHEQPQPERQSQAAVQAMSHSQVKETQAQHQHTIVSHTVMSHPRPSYGSSIHATCVLLIAVCKPTTPHFHQLKLQSKQQLTAEPTACNPNASSLVSWYPCSLKSPPHCPPPSTSTVPRHPRRQKQGNTGAFCLQQATLWSLVPPTVLAVACRCTLYRYTSSHTHKTRTRTHTHKPT